MSAFRGGLLVACLFAIACGAGEEKPPTNHPAATDATDPAPTPHSLTAIRSTELAGRDLGIGVLHFGWHEDRTRDGTADSILVRDAPDPAAPLVARYIYTFGASGTADADWGWRTEAAEAGLTASDVEFDYEENGLPIDSIAGEWVRVVYGVTATGENRAGWVRRRMNVEAVLWPDLFAERNLFFLDDVTPSFHSAPDGPLLQITLAREPDPPHRADYTLYADSLAGHWMRVRLVTPSNYCFDPLNPTEHTVWIRMLDERGRPRVFYHSRGC